MKRGSESATPSPMSAKFRIKRESLGKVKQNLLAYQKRKKRHFELGLITWADGTVTEAQMQLLKIGAFDQGILAAATERSEPTWNGTRIKIVVFNPMEYAIVVEFGRRAKSGKPPPLLSLVGWASRKGIISLPRNISFGGQYAKAWAASGAILRHMKNRGGKSGGKKTPMDPVVRDLLIVRLIAKKIYEKGIRGRHPFTKTYEKRMRVLRKEVRDTLQLLK